MKPAVPARFGKGIAAAVAAALLSVAPAKAEVAANDPRLIRSLEQACRAQALAQGGIDAKTVALCRCTAPVLAQQLTPAARESFALQNRAPDGPIYLDEAAVLPALLAACPEAKAP